MAHGSAGLGVGFWLMLQGELAHGGVAIFGGILGGKVLTPLVTIVAGWRQVGDAISSYKRLNQAFQDFPESEKGLQLPAPEGNVSVEGLVAGPPGVAINILKGLTFRVPKGHIVAVVGPSASGKTSLARLLVGVWGPTAGAVRLDGADVYHWPKDDLGQHVGYLPQDVELFEGSIAQNIARFGEVDDEKLAEALTIAGLQDLIRSLPEGAGTIVGGDGGFLSGGEKQKVALARAVYGRPPLIVLDEPNSSLDEAGDQQLNQAMLIAKSWGSTVFVITHRNSVLPVVDLLLVLQDGNLRLFGPRDEVLRALQGGGAPS
jgi:ATP-binding cassette subfamily C exporter for protease/lipase